MVNSPGTRNTLDAFFPGEAIFSLVGQPDPQVVFLVHERSAEIKYFGETSVDVRSELFLVEAVAVTAVIFRLGQHIRKEYVTWWNYHRPGSAEAFRIMTGQDFLSFHFYGDNGRRERTFVSLNSLKEFFSSAIDSIRQLQPWSEDQFDVARMKVRDNFPCK